LIGQVINYRYEVLEKCGDGNFFSVYKARDKVLNRLVAIKVVVPQYAQNNEFADRLISEAQMVTELSHPNIAKVLEADAVDGNYFVAVEYVRGVNLKDRIRRTSPFAISYAVDIAMAIAEALDHAHRQGLVHGDVRPHNIITSPEGQIKLTDFGTARALAAFPAIREATMLRSVHYMAPEVIRGETAQPTSDVYSLGVILYEMLTGSVPYDGATSAAIAARQLQDPVPSAQARNAGVPGVLNDIIMKAMSKDSSQRFATMASFIAAMVKVKEWLRTGQTPTWSAKHNSSDDELVYEPDDKPESIFKNGALIALGVLVVAVL
jgi:serine/threonine-protein kinase